MRVIPFLASLLLTTGLILVLDTKILLKAPLGRLLSPQQGVWQNAEPADINYSESLNFPGMRGKGEVYFDGRLVPHIFADNEEDACFMEGYLHAKFRLFQMDIQTKAAEGRASEIAGAKAIPYDREQRRLGMRFAAETTQKEVDKDSLSRPLFDAYTNGVNAYISSLTKSSLPLEYKLLGLAPEKWSNLRTALLLKMMAKMLSSGTENDLLNTNAKSLFTPAEWKMVYPEVPDSLEPIVPRGTPFPKPGISPVAPASADSLYFGTREPEDRMEHSKPDKDNGSNNWVVAGSKTKSGAPILCNDPHLELSLPSIWYELQVSTPTQNTYGVSLPGSPFIIIGFNDNIAWGVTNAQRDVKDYYDIRFKDNSRKEYWFNGQWKQAELRVEEIKVLDGPSVFDTVAYTVFGPVMYDGSFSTETSHQKSLAVRWVAHDPSNEGITFYKLNHARNYSDYEDAIRTFSCPGQNFIFASKSGDIAIWQQGKFPARWAGQGLYVMPGEDSSYMWKGFIPQSENPHSKNPAQGFLESANQRPVDSTYPYFIPGSYITPRGIAITKRLQNMSGITPQDMMLLQNDYFNTLAEDVRPLLLAFVREERLDADQKRYLDLVRQWDLKATPDSKGQTVYQCWWDSLQVAIWSDELSQVKPQAPYPTGETTMEMLKRDTGVFYINNINTPERETLHDLVTSALQKASVVLKQKETEGKLEWSAFKNPTVYHLLKEALMPFARTGLHMGGNGDIINAVTHSHGPSWRMIVSLTGETEAYGVYPGGQNGNPGSRYYDDFVDQWVVGKYYRLWVMKKEEAVDKRVKGKMIFGRVQ